MQPSSPGAEPRDFASIPLYHMTHWMNLRSILRYGLRSREALAEGGLDTEEAQVQLLAARDDLYAQYGEAAVRLRELEKRARGRPDLKDELARQREEVDRLRQRADEWEDTLELLGVSEQSLLEARRSDPRRDSADGQLLAMRTATTIPVPGGKPMTSYVPFYFTPRQPMLHALKDPFETIFLVFTVGAILEAGNRFAFSTSHFTAGGCRWHDEVDALGQLPWDVLDDYWMPTWFKGEKKLRRMAEFLVEGSLPAPLIGEIHVPSQRLRGRVSYALADAGLDEAIPVLRQCSHWDR